jgi:hypothetical protein
LRFAGAATPETKRLRVLPGIEIEPAHGPLAIGDRSERLRVLRASLDGRRYVAQLQGLRGRTYRVRLTMPFHMEAIDGGDVVGSSGDRSEVDVRFPTGEGDWSAKDLVVAIGQRKRHR